MKKTEGGVARGPTSAQVARALSSYSSHSCCCKAVMLDSFTQDGTCSPHLPQDSLHSREHTWEARGSSVPVQELIHQQDMAGGGEILQGLHILVLAVFLLPCNPNIKGQTVCVWGGCTSLYFPWDRNLGISLISKSNSFGPVSTSLIQCWLSVCPQRAE